jgi:hypothetical protein
MTSPIVNKVDTFIRRIHDSELVASKEANTFVFVNEKDNSKKSLSEYLADEIHKYEVASTDTPDLKSAVECSRWINRAFFYGLVEENREALMMKVKQKEEQIQNLETENKKLTEDAEKCATDLVFIQGKYDELNEKFNRMIPKGDIHE